MKHKIFKLVLSVVALGFTIASMSMIFAWYTNVNKVGNIDANSADVNITYTVNDGEGLNINEYKIKNLVFFDLDNKNEINLLNSMVHPIKITVKNLDNRAKDVTIRFVAPKQIKTSDDNKTQTSVAYPLGLLSSTSIIDISGKSLISELLPEGSDYKKQESLDYKSDLKLSCNANASVDFYVFMIGVQEIKGSENNLFLIDDKGNPIEYNFKIIVEAINS